MPLRKCLRVSATLAACSAGPGADGPRAPSGYRGGEAPLSRAADRAMIPVEGGPFIAGSTEDEREQAYADYRRSAGHDAARRGRWFDREEPRHEASLPPFRIDRVPVTQAAYAEYVADTGAPGPRVDRATWQRQGFSQDFDSEVVRFHWDGATPPPGRADHPVVLVTWHEAAAYCAWRGGLVGERRRLPTAHEFEKAARGTGGRIYPWGNDWDPGRLNSQAAGPDDTVGVGSFPSGASPYGMLDAAGNVFHWTSTPWKGSGDRRTVKGSAWDDYAGVGRGAQRHGRRIGDRHAIVGFRCAGDG